ncbi:MAG: 3-oxoacid CoA-transferase subunit A [Kiritimatiellia bacterium]|jgi:3-oxoacid CoA-transferase subunit A
MPTKVVPSVQHALSGLADGDRIAVAGFGLSGNPEALIRAVRESGARHLTLVSNNAGSLGLNLATWLQAGVVDRVICTYVGNNADLQQALNDGRVQVDIIPQGTFVERLRAAGAGLAGFYTPTGVGTVVERGKEVREFNGRRYLLEHALPVDWALVRVREADPFGNARFWRTSRNFGDAMAMAARTTVLEAERVVPLGHFDPDDVHLPGAFVQRVVEVATHEDVIERNTVRAL